MDPLSDLLRVVRLDGAFFYAVEAAEPWSVESAAAKELKPRILPAAEHLISYHILTQGRCYARLIGEEPVELLPCDVIVFPHGDANVMSSGRRLRGPGSTPAPPTAIPTPSCWATGDHRPHHSSADSSAAIAVRSTPCSRHSRDCCTCAACRTPGSTASPAN